MKCCGCQTPQLWCWETWWCKVSISPQSHSSSSSCSSISGQRRLLSAPAAVAVTSSGCKCRAEDVALPAPTCCLPSHVSQLKWFIRLMMTGMVPLQVFFAPPKPDEGDGEIIDWVEEEEEAGYMTPPADAQPAEGVLQPCSA